MQLLPAAQTDSYQRQGQADHHYYCDPGDQVEPARVGPDAHEVLLVDQQDHENQDEGQQHAVEDLRKQDHLHQRKAGYQDHAGASHDQQRVEGVKDGSFAPALVHARFESKAFANGIRGGERQNAGRENRGVEQAGAEQQERVLAERLEPQRRFGGVLNVPRPHDVEIAPAHATMMNNAITEVMMQPTMTSI